MTPYSAVFGLRCYTLLHGGAILLGHTRFESNAALTRSLSTFSFGLGRASSSQCWIWRMVT